MIYFNFRKSLNIRGFHSAQEVTRSQSLFICSSLRSSISSFLVRSFVHLYVRTSPFLILKFSCSLKPKMLSKLLTIVLGVMFCMFWTLLELWSCSLKLKINAEFEVAAWCWRLVNSLKLQYEWKDWLRVEFKAKVAICSWSLKWKLDSEAAICSWCLK